MWSTSQRSSRTKNGYLARVPEDAHSGDMIRVLHRSSVLYVVRKRSDGTSRLVGESYVHVFMHGDALSGSYLESQMLRIR